MTTNPLPLILAFAFHVLAIAAMVVLLCLAKGDGTLEMGFLAALVGTGTATGLLSYTPGATGPQTPVQAAKPAAAPPAPAPAP